MTKDFILGKHPVLIFLKEDLKMNLSEFCLSTGIPQSRGPSRNSTFLYGRVLNADLTGFKTGSMEHLYEKLRCKCE